LPPHFSQQFRIWPSFFIFSSYQKTPPEARFQKLK
jgi:hypothetical protein